MWVFIWFCGAVAGFFIGVAVMTREVAKAEQREFVAWRERDRIYDAAHPSVPPGEEEKK